MMGYRWLVVVAFAWVTIPMGSEGCFGRQFESGSTDPIFGPADQVATAEKFSGYSGVETNVERSSESEIVYEVFPQGRLWETPIGNQRAPRMFAKFNNANSESTIDTAIGGVLGVCRLGPEFDDRLGVQVDILAAVFTRFNEQRILQTADYRVGIPVTAAWGNWQGKISYEHTSTHLGDEYIERTGRLQREHVRDEVVFGLARRIETVRIYGQYGYSFATGTFVGDNRDRYNLGAEWISRTPTSAFGRPFAALDLDFRSDQDLKTNSTLQAGWQWRNGNRSGRVAAEYYNGGSPYGQFFDEDESWWGFGMYFDF